MRNARYSPDGADRLTAIDFADFADLSGSAATALRVVAAWTIAALGSVAAFHEAAAQDGVSQDGTALHLGSTDEHPGWAGSAGFTISVEDSTEPANTTTFSSKRNFAEWHWVASGGRPLMLLDRDNNLAVFDPVSSVPQIILSPRGGANAEADNAGAGAEEAEPLILLGGSAVVTEDSLLSLLPGAGEGIFLPLEPQSLSYGSNSTASGEFAFAGGDASAAEGSHAIALGYQAEASHPDSSYAIGYEVLASGKYALAMGRNAKAKAVNSVAIGNGAKSTGGAAVSLGKRTRASGHVATAMGWQTTASAEASTSTGLGTVAQGHSQFVIGAYNEASGDPALRTPSDQAFILGNGESQEIRSTAFSVSWSGDVHARGGIRADGPAILTYVPPQGDLSMGEFTQMPQNGESAQSGEEAAPE